MSASSLSHRLPTASELQLKKHSLKGPERKILSDTPKSVDFAPEITPREKASIVFDMACIKREAKNEWIAVTLAGKGFRVSEPLVSKWRDPQYDELHTYAHIVALGPEFEHSYFKALSKVNGWGRVALVQVAESLGEALALAVGE